MRYDESKPQPVADPESAPFWQAASEERLVIQCCSTCGHPRFPATTYCPQCRSDQYEWIEASGYGRVFSWIVVRHPVPAEAYSDEVPYTVALVTLDEGPRLVTNLVDCGDTPVTADMRVKVAFAPGTEGRKLPVFHPIDMSTVDTEA